MNDDLPARMQDILERSLHGEVTAAELERLAAWRAATPGNAQLLQRTERLIGAVRGLHAQEAPPPPTAATIVGKVAAAARPSSTTRRIVRWVPWGIAAAAVLVAGLNLRSAPPPAGWTPAEIVTGPQELATVKLGDGTVVRLGPTTRLIVNGDRPREARLEGRAFFAVTARPDHPFLVHTRSGTAKVLGTRFQVTTEEDGLRLLVLEGLVALEAPENTVEVRAGEQSGVRFRAATRPTRFDNTSAEQAWLGRFLVFQDTPLQAASREIERLYGVRVVVSVALSDETVTATFTDRPLDDVVAVVCAVVNAQCTIRNDSVSVTR